MKRNRSVLVVLFIVFGTIALFAADITGAWSGTAKGPDGNDFTLALTLKQDGAALTGTVTGPDGNAIEITDGKVEADKLSFNVSVQGMTIVHEGVIKGDDDIALTAKFPQGSNIPDLLMDLKRKK